METLWKEGIDIFDGFTRQTFNLRAIIFVTIHDYQTLFVLSGQIKGRMGCTVCVDDTVSCFLEGSRKVLYLGYRRFLVEGHRNRSKKFYKFFDGKPDLHSALVKRDGYYVSKMVRTI
jgi:prolipoprotein diacylglyceryltransferase